MKYAGNRKNSITLSKYMSLLLCSCGIQVVQNRFSRIPNHILVIRVSFHSYILNLIALLSSWLSKEPKLFKTGVILFVLLPEISHALLFFSAHSRKRLGKIHSQ